MEALKAEIERKKRALQEKAIVGPQKKFFKKEELLKKEEEEYWQREREKASSSYANDSSSNGVVDSVAAKSALTSVIKDDGEEERILNRREVIRRLRERQEPITLFGENELMAFRRLRQLEILEPELERGFRNDFQEAMEKMDQKAMDEILKSGSSSTDDKKSGAHDVKVHETDTTIDDIKSMAANLGRKRDEQGMKQDCEVVLLFLKFLLELWGKQLNDRPDEEKTTTAGKVRRCHDWFSRSTTGVSSLDRVSHLHTNHRIPQAPVQAAEDEQNSVGHLEAFGEHREAHAGPGVREGEWS